MSAERLAVVLSDNIRIRCGCHTARDGNAPVRVVYEPVPPEIVGIVECLRCTATWTWGEVCAGNANA